ncbi:hypothetical protein PT015_14820 [Candidatus Mycobacterium wuenschmannii]|uniref:Transmembrane protein n=1 Tax=Candidatus Mycobacterium wuenschmannii TaxID=3027808 RepID=A0ABY8VVJ6_9MYCO|nr:hypothetical protein [Candidatus Mycobacterium wuenschmannii]WIM86183.1 hypothetical protein PT015_14820 [Candidatus Mycobacterium wuenschmannii]
MKSRYVPYANTPGRLAAQLLIDALVVIWSFVWVLVGLAVYSAVATIAEVGRQVQGGADGVADSLESAGHSASHIPLVGGAVSEPLKAASKAALDIAGAGHNLDSTASWLAVVLALAVAAPPTLGLVVPWLVLRIRFVRRKLTVGALAATPAGAQLLALRALANRPLARLTAITPDPVGAWRAGDPHAIHGLAAIELRSAGMAVRTR